MQVSCQKRNSCSNNQSGFCNTSYLICFQNREKSSSIFQSKNFSERGLSSLFVDLPTILHENSDLANLSNWRLYASDCSNVSDEERFCYSSKSRTITSCKENDTFCFSSNIEKIFAPNFCYPFNRSCENKITEHDYILLRNIKFLYMIFGAISLMGNLVVLTQKTVGMVRNAGDHKEVQIYNILVLNLSIVDLLMGIYITVLAVSIDRLVVKGKSDHFLQKDICNTLGVVNFISSQISVTCLVIISSFRLWGTLFPYKRVRLKTAYILIAGTWIVWCSLGIAPVVDIEIFSSFFSYGIGVHQDSQINIHVSHPKILFDNIFDAICKGDRNCRNLMEKKVFSYPVLEMLHLLKVNFGNATGENLGYYTKQSACSVNLIIDDPYASSSIFTLFVILYNLISFVVVFIFYALIMKSISGDQKSVNYGLICCSLKETIRGPSNNASKKRTMENESMFRRVFVIVFTDFVCWIPICLFSLLYFIKVHYLKNKGCEISSQFCSDLDLYYTFQTAVCAIVPLNSVINPYIYSFNFWKQLYVKIKNSVT